MTEYQGIQKKDHKANSIAISNLARVAEENQQVLTQRELRVVDDDDQRPSEAPRHRQTQQLDCPSAQGHHDQEVPSNLGGPQDRGVQADSMDEQTPKRDQSDCQNKTDSKAEHLTARDGEEFQGMTPKSKSKSKTRGQKLIDHKASARRIRTLFQETVSTKVKKQEKYLTEEKPGWNRNNAEGQPMKSQRGNPSTAQLDPAKPGPLLQQKHITIPLNANTKNNSNMNIRQVKERERIPSHRVSSIQRKTNKLDDEGLESDNDGDTQAEKLKKKQEIFNRFRRIPIEPELNADGSEKFVVRTKLMLKILNMKQKAEHEHSEDNMVNSFDEQVSTCSYDEEDDEVDEEEKKARIAKKKAKKKKAKKANMLKILQMNMLKKQLAGQKKKIRRPIMNVYCTDYDVVKKVAKAMINYRLKEYREDHDGGVAKDGTPGQKLMEDWDVSWHNVGITADYFSKMLPYQKVNQFVGIQAISRKNNLARNLMKMKKAYPKEFDFFPKTYILPGESSEFRNNFIDKYGRIIQRKKSYIVKPDNLAQGRGIYLARNYDKIMDQVTAEGGGWVVQDYLAAPHLIENLKYDLRLYVLLYGLNPLRIFIHQQGIARFATEPYERPKASNLDNMYVHLTNYAINKTNKNFKQSNKKAKKEDYGDYGDYGDYDDEYDDEEESGHKRSLFAVMKLIYQQGGDPDKIWDEIKDIVVKTIMSGQPYMDYMYRVCQPECIDNSMAFQILGFDVMIDKHFRPWLIEVNQSPSFGTDSPLDYEVKKHVLKDAMVMLNISQEKREAYQKQKKQQDEERILTGKNQRMSPREKEKLKAQKIQERVDFERIKLNGSGYEQIFPQVYDDEKNDQYNTILKKAKDIWDDFTTGKNKRQKHEDPSKKKKPPQKKESMISQPEIENLDASKSRKQSNSISDRGSIKSEDKNEVDLQRQNSVDSEKMVSESSPKFDRSILDSHLTNQNNNNENQVVFNPQNEFGQVPFSKNDKQNIVEIKQTYGRSEKKMSENVVDRNYSSNEMKNAPQMSSNLDQNNKYNDYKNSVLKNAHDRKALSHQTPEQFMQHRRQPIVLHPKQIQNASSNYYTQQHTQKQSMMNQQFQQSSSREQLGASTDHENKTASIDSRPQSNPQGSPSKRYNVSVSEQSTPHNSRDCQLKENFTAQKQYLEDIVQRQEQKIKFYQKIIQQQKIIDDKIQLTTSAISRQDTQKIQNYEQISSNYNNAPAQNIINYQQQAISSFNSQQQANSLTMPGNSRIMSEGRSSDNFSNISQFKNNQFISQVNNPKSLRQTHFSAQENQIGINSRMTTEGYQELTAKENQMLQQSLALKNSIQSQQVQLSRFEKQVMPLHMMPGQLLKMEDVETTKIKNTIQRTNSQINMHTSKGEQSDQVESVVVSPLEHIVKNEQQMSKNMFVPRMATVGQQHMKSPNINITKIQPLKHGESFSSSPLKTQLQSMQDISRTQSSKQVMQESNQILVQAMKGEVGGKDLNQMFKNQAKQNEISRQNLMLDVTSNQDPNETMTNRTSDQLTTNYANFNKQNIKFKNHEFQGPYNIQNGPSGPGSSQYKMDNNFGYTPQKHTYPLSQISAASAYAYNKQNSPTSVNKVPQHLSLTGTKKECHAAYQKYEHQDLKSKYGKQAMNPIEFSKIIEEQENFIEKSKKDQFRDYKNLVYDQKSIEKDRRKRDVQKIQQSAKITSQQNQFIQDKDISDNIFVIQQSKINFQDQQKYKQMTQSMNNQNQFTEHSNSYNNTEMSQSNNNVFTNSKTSTDATHLNTHKTQLVQPHTEKKYYPHVSMMPVAEIPIQMIQVPQTSINFKYHTKKQSIINTEQILKPSSKILSNSSISPLTTTGYRNQLQYGQIGQIGPMPLTRPIINSNPIKSNLNEVKSMSNQMKERGRTSGLKLGSPILSSQGMQIAGMTNQGGSLHNTQSPMKEYDTHQKMVDQNVTNQIINLKPMNKQSNFPSINHQLSISSQQLERGNDKEPQSSNSINQANDQFKMAGHQAMFGRMYVSNSKKNVMPIIERQRHSLGPVPQQSHNNDLNSGQKQ